MAKSDHDDGLQWLGLGIAEDCDRQAVQEDCHLLFQAPLLE